MGIPHPGKNSDARVLAARAAGSVINSPGSATPLYSEMSAVLQYLFIFLSRQSFPNFSLLNKSPSSDRATTTFERITLSLKGGTYFLNASVA